MFAKGDRIDLMLLAPPLTRSLDPLVSSAIHGQAFSQLEWPPGPVPAATSIHGLWEFQELYQAKSWNGQEP